MRSSTECSSRAVLLIRSDNLDCANQQRRNTPELYKGVNLKIRSRKLTRKQWPYTERCSNQDPITAWVHWHYDITFPDQDPIIAPINRGIEKGFWVDLEASSMLYKGFSGRGHWLRPFFPWRASQWCPHKKRKAKVHKKLSRFLHRKHYFRKITQKSITH